MSGRIFPPYGIGPAVWGPYFWTTMHIVSLGSPAAPSTEEKEGIRMFYESLQIVIPCPICRTHYKEALATIPIRLGSRNELVEWVYDIHNHVNEQLGKPVFPWDSFIAAMRALGPPSPSPSTAVEGSPWVPLLLGIGLGIAGTAGYMRLRGGR
jgi:FAD-linked sulfhydryl oxidase